jgi:succinyl-CoA synthetase beta subunit
MRLTGMKYGAPILKLAEFPIPEILEADATVDRIEALIEKRGKCVVKPVFHGGVGKKGKAGLVKIVDNASDALKAKQQLYFAEHNYWSTTKITIETV